MKNRFSLPLTIAFAFSVTCISVIARADEIDFGSTPEAIYGGTPVTRSSPISKSTVKLENCTAVLVDDDLAMTAGHCANPGSKITFGPNWERSKTTRPIVGYRIHPLFRIDGDRAHHDIQLFRFSGGLPSGYKSIPILPRSDWLVSGAAVTIAGYGAKTDPRDKTLTAVTLDVIDPKFSDHEFLLDAHHGKSACSGDSGGPGFVTIHGKTYLAGLVTRGVKSPGLPETCGNMDDLLTLVPAEMNWIYQAASELRSPLSRALPRSLRR